MPYGCTPGAMTNSECVPAPGGLGRVTASSRAWYRFGRAHEFASKEGATMFWILLFLAQGAASNQLDRGEALFNDTAKGCVSCHALKGKGTAVGPDLKGVSRLSPKGIAMAVRSTVTQYVQTAKVK